MENYGETTKFGQKRVKKWPSIVAIGRIKLIFGM